MPPPDDNSATPSPGQLFAGREFSRDEAAGTVTSPAGERVVFAGDGFSRALRHVLEAEKPGTWSATLARSGSGCGRQLAVSLDRELARLGQPALDAIPLESCLGFIEHYFATHGLGLLTSDLSDAADHGLVVARLTRGYFPEILPHADGLVDALPAGLLQGFFEHVSGQTLGCLEIACAHLGVPHCTFVIATSDRLDPVAPLAGRESAEAILAQLRT
ncbi:MAG: hypothetical protein EXS32_02655 [Opitutus sp.]|nr:hypothetical protein [Opitutus sp.]